MILAENTRSQPKVSLIPNATGYQVLTAAGIIGHILGTAHDKDVEAVANLKPANGYGRELVGTFTDISQALTFITTNGSAL